MHQSIAAISGDGGALRLCADDGDAADLNDGRRRLSTKAREKARKDLPPDDPGLD
jgi:hypothetical protein